MGGAVANTMNSNAGTPVTGRAYTPSYTGGSGGKGGGRPTQTAMGTPIVYGKSYINNLSKDYVAPLAKETVVTGGDGDGVSVGGGTSGTTSGVTDGNTANSITGLAAPANLSIPDVSLTANTAIGNTGATSEGLAANALGLAVDDASISEGVSAPSEGGSSDGTAGGSVGVGDAPGWANGTMSVPRYAYGSTSVRGYAMGSIGVDDDPWAWSKTQPMSAPSSAKIEPSNEQALGRVPDRVEQQLGSMVMSKGIDAATTGINTAYKAYNTAAPLAAAAETGAAVAEASTAAGALGAGGTAMMGALTATPVGPLVAGLYAAKKLGIF